MKLDLRDKPRHMWALSFTCPHCKEVTSTPITIHHKGKIKLYCPSCNQFMKAASRTEKRFM